MAGEAAHRAAAGGGFHLLDAGLAVQRLLVALLDAELADVVGAPVIRLFFLVPVFHRGLLALVDAADVADDVRCHFAVRVTAKETCLDLDARKAVALGCEARDLLVAQAGADGDGVEAARVFAQALEAAAVVGRDLDDGVQLVQGGVEVAHLRGRDLQGVGRIVRGQHDAVAVQDLSPVGHDRHDGGAVAFRPVGQFFVAHDLQESQARADQSEAEQHHTADHHHTATKTGKLGGGIADFIHLKEKNWVGDPSYPEVPHVQVCAHDFPFSSQGRPESPVQAKFCLDPLGARMLTYSLRRPKLLCSSAISRTHIYVLHTMACDSATVRVDGLAPRPNFMTSRPE